MCDAARGIRLYRLRRRPHIAHRPPNDHCYNILLQIAFRILVFSQINVWMHHTNKSGVLSSPPPPAMNVACRIRSTRASLSRSVGGTWKTPFRNARSHSSSKDKPWRVEHSLHWPFVADGYRRQPEYMKIYPRRGLTPGRNFLINARQE